MTITQVGSFLSFFAFFLVFFLAFLAFRMTGQHFRGFGRCPKARPEPFPAGLVRCAGVSKSSKKVKALRWTCLAVRRGGRKERSLGNQGGRAGETR